MPKTTHSPTEKPAAETVQASTACASADSVIHDLIAKAPFGLVAWRFDNLDDPTTLRMVAINGYAARVRQFDPEKVIGQLAIDLIPRIRESGILDRYAQVIRSGQPQVMESWRYNDDNVPETYFRVHAFPLLDQHLGVTFEDITERKHAEDIVQQLADTLSPSMGDDFFRNLVIRLAQSCHADFALIGRIQSSSSAVVQTLAVAQQGKLIDNFTYELKDTPCEQVMGREMCHISTGVQAQFPRDSLLVDMNIDCYLGIPLFSGKGTPTGLIALLHNKPLPHADHAKTILRIVAARAAAELDRQISEEALRSSEAFLRMAQRIGNVGSWQWDLQTNRVHWSDSMFTLYGFTESDFDGTLESAMRPIHPDDANLLAEAMRKIFEEGAGITAEYRITRPNGEIGYMWTQSNVIQDATGKPTRVVGTVVDLTARKQAEAERQRLEAQIQQTQKLESLGVLAGGIAHDFNNILTGLLGYTDLAMHDLPNESSARPFIHEAVKAARRAAELTKQMLAYSGRGQFIVTAVNLNTLIQDMVPLIQVSISKKCSLTYNLKRNLQLIDADAVQIRQIVMNLIINAADAIGDNSGVITIETGSMYCDSAYLSATYLREALAAGEYVYMQVTDSGCGMPEETRAKIFDPFFTTKFTGRGLGLAAVLGIVRGHRGAITVDSTVDKGTTFRIVFPVGTSQLSAQSNKNTDGTTWQGKGTVLVIDDEEAIRNLATLMLKRMGFNVISASNGREAIDLFRQRPNEIRLVLLDMTMPHLDGEETFAALCEIRSDVKAILSSGYDEQSATRKFAGTGLSGFIQKPYTYEQLTAACHKAVETNDTIK